MRIECCDICKKKMCDFTDKNGEYWPGVSFQAKRYRRKVLFMADGWTEYLSICGRCRSKLAALTGEESDGKN